MEQEKEKARLQAQYNKFLPLMEQTPPSAVPAFCRLRPDPKNSYATMAPEQSLTEEQIKTCIDAADAWWAQERQRQQQQAKVYDQASRWETVEADNGTVYKVDVGHITPWSDGGVNVFVLEKGNNRMRELHFNCRGQWMDVRVPGSGGYAPPRSVAGQIGAIACAGAKNTR